MLLEMPRHSRILIELYPISASSIANGKLERGIENRGRRLQVLLYNAYNTTKFDEVGSTVTLITLNERNNTLAILWYEMRSNLLVISHILYQGIHPVSIPMTAGPAAP